jgi:hypothetical protein
MFDSVAVQYKNPGATDKFRRKPDKNKSMPEKCRSLSDTYILTTAEGTQILADFLFGRFLHSYILTTTKKGNNSWLIFRWSLPDSFY